LGSPISGPAIKFAAKVCERFGSIPYSQLGSPDNTSQLRRVGLPLAASLPVAHIFRDLVAALIEGASRGEFYKCRADGQGDKEFVVIVNGPIPTAEVKWIEYQSKPTSPKQSKHIPWIIYEYLRRPWESDLHQSRQITFVTLRTLGNLISPESGSHVSCGPERCY
jgi:hypothetical protein